MVLKIGIIGAGVVGLSTAVQLVEHLNHQVEVTIFTDDITPNTTGDGAAGIWTVYFLVEDTPMERLRKWGKDGFENMHKLWKSGFSEEAGICLIPSIQLSHKNEPFDEKFKDLLFGWQRIGSKELEEFSLDHGVKYNSGSRSVVFVCEVSRYLKFLTKRFKAAGGRMIHQHISRFEDLEGHCEVIINCSGLQSQYLANDLSVHPIRGQTIRIDAPWHFHTVLSEPLENQIVPNIDSIFLGGTSQLNNYNKELSPVDTEHIYKGCIHMCKSLKNEKILREWVGLRPGRSSVRLEMETINSTITKMPLTVIHNYGHGGSGVTMSWGCSKDVLILIKKELESRGLKSKL